MTVMCAASLSFVQLNAHRAQAAATHLHASLLHADQIGLISEPYTYNNKCAVLPTDFKSLPRNALTSRPRAAILHHRSRPLVEIAHLSNPDCAVALVPDEQPLLVVAAYMDINLDMTPEWLTAVVQFAATKNYRLLIGMDANAHSPLIGGDDTNVRGEIFEEFTLSHGLTIENVGDQPTFEVIRNNKLFQSCIDVTLSNDGSNISNWRVDRSYNGSDHNTILFSISTTKPVAQEARLWNKADWPVFRDVLAQTEFHIPTMVNNKKLDKMVALLNHSILLAMNKAVPLIRIKNKPTPSHWYTDDLKSLSSKVRAAYDKMRRTMDVNDEDSYKELQVEYRRACKKARRSSWQKFTADTDSIKKMAFLNKILQRQQNNKIDVLVRADGTSTEPGADTLQALVRTHFPKAVPVPHITYSAASNADMNMILDSLDDWISPSVVIKALRKFDAKKSPGPDGFRPVIFKHFPPNVIHFLVAIYKTTIHLQYTPKMWKETKVIFIPKPGKETYNTPKSFRPISLSNYLLKGLERICVWHVDRQLVDFPLHEAQHGFTRGKSTETAASNTLNKFERAVFEKLKGLGIFLDISSAFDTINVDHIHRSLLKHGCHPLFAGWYREYLGGRFLNLSLHDESFRVATSTGFPQGGVCSAKFWLIAFNPAIEIINDSPFGISGTGYADDLCVMHSGRRVDHLVKQMQPVLDKLVDWGKSCDLQFNASKTVSIVFSRKKQEYQKYTIKMGGVSIPHSQSTVYLGITLDRKLRWNLHIRNKINKAKKLLMNIARATRTIWGPTPAIMRWAFLGIVRPMLLYAALVWGHEVQHATIVKALQRLNRLAISTFAHFYRSVPSRALELIVDVMPLPLFIQQTATNTYVRIFSKLPKMEWSGTYGNKTYSTSHLKYWDTLIHNWDLQHLLVESDAMSEPMPQTRFQVDLASFSKAPGAPVPSQLTIFTDGSKIDKATGAGFVAYGMGGVVLEEQSWRLSNGASVFQAEVAAITKAAVWEAPTCRRSSSLRYV